MSARLRTPVEPRLLSKDEAASYCGLSVPTFVSACPVIPIKIRTRVLYDRRALDTWVDSLAPDRPQSRTVDEIVGRLEHAHARQGN